MRRVPAHACSRASGDSAPATLQGSLRCAQEVGARRHTVGSHGAERRNSTPTTTVNQASAIATHARPPPRTNLNGSATSPRTGETEADASRLAWPVPRRGTRLPGAWASGATAAHARQRASSPSPRDRGRDGTTRGRYLPAIAEAPRSQPCLKAGAPPPKR